MTRDEYEKNVRSLTGKSIISVMYHEIDYGDGKFHFFDDSRFDSLDYGLEIKLNTDDIVSIIWGAEFYQYGISINNISMSTLLSNSRSLDVSNTNGWISILNKKINSADVFWSWVEVEESGNPKTRTYYPQDLVLGFDHEYRVVISALEIREKDWSVGMTDNITVFHDTEIAKQFKCLAEA